MKIYTRTGDKGQTSLYDGTRSAKTDHRFEFLGQVDTLNAQIGVCCSLSKDADLINEWQNIQKHLLAISAEVAKAQNVRNQVTDQDIVHLENRIDFLTDETKPLKSLILPGGSQLGATIHLARTQARLIERIFLHLDDKPENPAIPIYLNRLSDYFFAVARFVNEQAKIVEPEWI